MSNINPSHFQAITCPNKYSHSAAHNLRKRVSKDDSFGGEIKLYYKKEMIKPIVAIVMVGMTINIAPTKPKGASNGLKG